jgi:hypothetical protein
MVVLVKIEFTDKEFRRLLDMVYIGNWILNSIRGDDRFEDYDHVESKIFSECAGNGMDSLYEVLNGEVIPSAAYENGGIHEAIMDYEDTVFFEILAEELARRDMDYEPINTDNFDELAERVDEYITEFETNGIENITFEK